MPTGLRKEPHVFNLPQTFSERHTRATISYEVSLKLIRNKLRADHRQAFPPMRLPVPTNIYCLRIPAQFGYVPVTRPGPFSPLRRLAYAQGTSLIGPTGDPHGWHSSEVIHLEGTVFNTRPLRTSCQVGDDI